MGAARDILLAGKVAFVSEASKGMGVAIADALAGAGAGLVLTRPR